MAATSKEEQERIRRKIEAYGVAKCYGLLQEAIALAKNSKLAPHISKLAIQNNPKLSSSHNGKLADALPKVSVGALSMSYYPMIQRKLGVGSLGFDSSKHLASIVPNCQAKLLVLTQPQLAPTAISATVTQLSIEATTETKYQIVDYKSCMPPEFINFLCRYLRDNDCKLEVLDINGDAFTHQYLRLIRTALGEKQTPTKVSGEYAHYLARGSEHVTVDQTALDWVWKDSQGTTIKAARSKPS